MLIWAMGRWSGAGCPQEPPRYFPAGPLQAQKDQDSIGYQQALYRGARGRRQRWQQGTSTSLAQSAEQSAQHSRSVEGCLLLPQHAWRDELRAPIVTASHPRLPPVTTPPAKDKPPAKPPHCAGEGSAASSVGHLLFGVTPGILGILKGMQVPRVWWALRAEPWHQLLALLWPQSP